MSINVNSLKDYFSNTISYNKSENYLAGEILKGFEIDNSDKLYRFGQYIKYKTDDVFDLGQTMSKLDYTLYTGEGDCEDFTRAYVVLLKKMKLTAFYWLMWTDRNYDNGHAIPLFIDENGFLTALNYTNYYKCTSIKLTLNDYLNENQNFQNAFNSIRSKLAQEYQDFFVNVIVQTDSNEMPMKVNDVPYVVNNVDIEYITHPMDRTLVLTYINNMNLNRNISLSDFTVPIIASVIVLTIINFLRR